MRSQILILVLVFSASAHALNPSFERELYGIRDSIWETLTSSSWMLHGLDNQEPKQIVAKTRAKLDMVKQMFPLDAADRRVLLRLAIPVPKSSAGVFEMKKYLLAELTLLDQVLQPSSQAWRTKGFGKRFQKLEKDLLHKLTWHWVFFSKLAEELADWRGEAEALADFAPNDQVKTALQRLGVHVSEPQFTLDSNTAALAYHKSMRETLDILRAMELYFDDGGFGCNMLIKSEDLRLPRALWHMPAE